jgi:AAA15 family ATPase/GTPase
MIIRFVIENIFSFGTQKEYNLFPNPRLGTLKEHVYKFPEVEILKLSAIYGANGAGKSNLVCGLSILQFLITQETIPAKLKNSQFKFQQNKERRPQLLAIEFIHESKVFYYGIELLNGIVITEELYESGFGNQEDKLIFERKTIDNQSTILNFSEDFEKSERNKILKEILVQEFIKPDKTIFKLIANRDNKDLKWAKKAYEWFENMLTIIAPNSKPSGFAHHVDTNLPLKKFANDMMSAFNIGIVGLSIQNYKLEDFFSQQSESSLNALREKVEAVPQQIMEATLTTGHKVVLEKKDTNFWVKSLQIQHQGANSITADFDLSEESDGTIRLLDFVPWFFELATQPKVYVIDELERSLHPLLVKELVKKFSLDTQSKGQLIFTTHESNLLDQSLFRQDEIWFAEKDFSGMTDLYSLSVFKEHKTIDVQKGYLNGRYGSIPFLGNLQDLNWHNYVTQE